MEDRRGFLYGGIVITGGLALGASGLFVRRSQARSALTKQLVDDVPPTLDSNSAKELKTLPGRSRDEIKRYFHGKCLNVESFVSHLCSSSFGNRLARCRTADDQDACFMQAFCDRVTTEGEILNQVETIAADAGSEIDNAWVSFNAELSGKWNRRLPNNGNSPSVNSLSDRLEGLIRSELTQAALQARSGNQVAVGKTIGEIGKSAILLLRLSRLGPWGLVVGVPVFILIAAHQLWPYLVNQLKRRRGAYQAAISGRLAGLANRVGAEFEREVRQRVLDLHLWREGAVLQTASRLAEERVGLI